MSKEVNTKLYRHWNGNELLYVGISLAAITRLGQHASKSSWMSEVTNVTIENFYSREEALEAERLAIKNEYPRFNRQGSSSPI